MHKNKILRILKVKILKEIEEVFPNYIKNNQDMLDKYYSKIMMNFKHN